MDASTELPNLKISVENHGETDDTIEIEDVDQDEDISAGNDDGKVNISVNLDSLKQNVKKYENPQADLIKGCDLKVIQEKLQNRASRFGLDGPSSSKIFPDISDDDIKVLYKGFNIDEKQVNNGSVRLEVIHIRGVEDMSTENVFSYFKAFFPASVEWINDYSCNVVWLKSDEAAKAMLFMTTSFLHKKNHSSKIPIKSEKEEGEIQHDGDGDVVMVVDEDEDDGDVEKNNDTESMESGETKSLETVDGAERDAGKEESEIQTCDIGIPIPPGIWRIGEKHGKAKTLLLRFANKDDRKAKGAEKISKYYKKYGNPNFGGLQGVISKSRKRKILSDKPDNEFKKNFDNLSEDENLRNSSASESDEEYFSKSKIPRKKMYADIEEAKVKERNKKRMAENASLVRTKITAVVQNDTLPDLRSKLNRNGKKSVFSRISYETKSSDSDLSDDYSHSDEDRRDDRRSSHRGRINERDERDDKHSRRSRNDNRKDNRRPFYRNDDRSENSDSYDDEQTNDHSSGIRSEIRVRKKCDVDAPKSDVHSRIKSCINRDHRSPLVQSDL